MGVLTATPVAAAGDDSACLKTKNDGWGNIVCARRAYVVDSTDPTNAQPGSSEPDIPDWHPPPGSEWTTWLAWGTKADNSLCYYMTGAWVPDGAGPAVSGNNSIEIELMKMWARNGNGDPAACISVAEIVAGGPPPMLSEAVLWDAISVVLPRPDPLYVAPGKALTGMPAWLETNRPLTHTVGPSGLAAMPGGLVTVEADATFTVDWDDDSPYAEPDDTVYQREGLPPQPDDPDNPDGIRHTYTTIPDTGDATITVTDAWTVTFEDQWGRSDTLTGTIDTSTTIPVTELQAIVTG